MYKFLQILMSVVILMVANMHVFGMSYSDDSSIISKAGPGLEVNLDNVSFSDEWVKVQGQAVPRTKGFFDGGGNEHFSDFLGEQEIPLEDVLNKNLVLSSNTLKQMAGAQLVEHIMLYVEACLRDISSIESRSCDAVHYQGYRGAIESALYYVQNCCSYLKKHPKLLAEGARAYASLKKVTDFSRVFIFYVEEEQWLKCAMRKPCKCCM